MKKDAYLKKVQKKLPSEIDLIDETSFEFSLDEQLGVIGWINYFNTHYRKEGKSNIPDIQIIEISSRFVIDLGLYTIPHTSSRGENKHEIYLRPNLFPFKNLDLDFYIRMIRPYTKPPMAIHYIDHYFLKRHGFSDPIRIWSKERNQFLVYYEKEGIDSNKFMILIDTLEMTEDAQGGLIEFSELTKEEHIEKFSDIEDIVNNHSGEFNVYLNSFDNLITTLYYQQDLISFFDSCLMPLE